MHHRDRSLGSSRDRSRRPPEDRIGQGPRDLRGPDRATLLLVASDRISTYDVVHPTPIPDKGKVLTGLSAFWFEQTADIVANHLISVTDGVPAEARGRGMLVRRLEMLPVECVVRGYITGSGWKDYQATGRVSRDRAAARAARVRPAARAALHAEHQGQRRPRRGDRLRGRRRADRRPRAGRARPRRRRSSRLLKRAAEHALRARDHPRRHEVRARARCRRRADARRRGVHARLLALLARRPVRAGPLAAELRQAVRARLGLRRPGWDRTPPAPAIPDDVVAHTREKYVEAYERITGEPFEEWLRSTGARADPLMRARVLVRPKAGILDPQGQAVERALPALGFDGVSNVHVGRLIELDVEDPGSCPRCASGCSSNPLIEDYEIVEDGAPMKFGRGPSSRARATTSTRSMPPSAGRRRGAPVARRPRPPGVDAVIVPGGFSYGDYLRAGAIARFAPVMEEVAEFARAGGFVLGSATASRCCARRPAAGRAAPEHSLKFVFRQVELEVVDRDTPFTRACGSAQPQRLSIPVKHTTGRFYSPDPVHVVAPLRAPATTRTAPRTTSPAYATKPATCSG